MQPLHGWRPEPMFLSGLLMRWRQVVPGHDELFESLVKRWSEPHRRYHNLRHLHETLAALDALDGGVTERIAAWYHDAVYDFEPGRDELRSAELAVHDLNELVDIDVLTDVDRLILLTTTHDPDPDDELGVRLSDADLAILGADSARFEESCRELRSEYAHVGDREFRRNRIGVLSDFLDRDAIYHTTLGQQLWEERARANLKAELARLR